MFIEEKKETLKRYINALIKQDKEKVKDSLSQDFGIHQNKNKTEHIKHEMQEFLKRSKIFELKENHFHLELNHIFNNHYKMFLLDKNHKFVYEDIFHFDEENKIIGNQTHWEIIPKLKFISNNIKRGLAIRNNEEKPYLITLHFDKPKVLKILQSDSDPEYSNVEIEFNDENGLSRSLEATIFGGEIKKETLKLDFNGIDHPYFKENLYPKIIKNKIEIPQYTYKFWELCVIFKDNTRINIENPTKKEYQFEKEISKAILTDALDNDWETENAK